jgi:hypothetical protein
MTNLDSILQTLKNSIGSSRFPEECHVAIEKLEHTPNGLDSVEPILRLMEENESVDFGMPGPLAHFLETFYQNGYEERLEQSLGRRPTMHTLWMLNRLINGSSGSAKDRFVRVLDQVIARAGLSNEIRQSAEEFRELHE